jgi:hypothetical protein
MVFFERENARRTQRDREINNNISPSPNITHMKYLIICTLILAGVLIAGCTIIQVPPATPAPTAAAVTTVLVTATPQPSFSTGDHYLQKSYSFYSEKDQFTEEFRIPVSQPWALKFDVTTLNDNLQYCWFVIKITNMDSQQVEVFGYGREQSFEKNQMYPMYGSGPYKIEMTGNRVKVNVDVAKRNP